MMTPSIPAGFMELLPEDQIRMNTMKNIITRTFEKYGFLPLDTPVIEKSEVLLAKGGGETEKQIYRFTKGSNDLSLRFDLTVPLARFVAQHQNELSFPFRRYQIGKVYRGERAQKGRFREFYQCDIDIIGSETLSILNHAEIPAAISEIFCAMGLNEFVFHVNNRKILNGLFTSLGVEEPALVLRAVDKLDKIGREGVEKELAELGMSAEKQGELFDFLSIDGSNDEVLSALDAFPCEDEMYKLGIEELATVLGGMAAFGVAEKNMKIDLSIARGLDYYTGTVFETFLTGYESMGSICSGGSYDDLASHYSKKKLPGVGISIGLTRLYTQLEEAGLFRFPVENHLEVLVLPFPVTMEAGIKLVQTLRNEGIIAQIYLESGKMGKKFTYADKLHAPYVVVVGESELQEGKYMFRDMATGDQTAMTLDELTTKLKAD